MKFQEKSVCKQTRKIRQLKERKMKRKMMIFELFPNRLVLNLFQTLFLKERLPFLNSYSYFHRFYHATVIRFGTEFDKSGKFETHFQKWAFNEIIRNWKCGTFCFVGRKLKMNDDPENCYESLAKLMERSRTTITLMGMGGKNVTLMSRLFLWLIYENSNLLKHLRVS